MREPLVTRAELARLAACSPSTIDRARRAGMPSIQIGRRLRRFRPGDALSWLEANRLTSSHSSRAEAKP